MQNNTTHHFISKINKQFIYFHNPAICYNYTYLPTYILTYLPVDGSSVV